MKNKIYKLWWQGMDNAPDIVRVCHESLLRNCDFQKQELILLDESNIFDYVNLPGYIMDKFHKGLITITHLSDIIRSMLLKRTGGLWTDATMLFTKAILDEIFEKDFFTLKNPVANKRSITSKWESFFIAGQKDFPLFEMLEKIWLEYWKQEDELIAYLLTDHIFYIGYMENKRIHEALESCPSFYYAIDHFQKKMNEKYEKDKYNEIIKNEPYIKLTYKNDMLRESIDGKDTYYGMLIKEYIR